MESIIAKRYYLELSLNDNKPYINKDLFCKVNDSIKLYIKIKEDGINGIELAQRDLTNCRISMLSIKRSGNHDHNRTIELGVKQVVVDGGYIVITPKRAFTDSIGSVVSEITIYDDDEAITLQTFVFQVIKGRTESFGFDRHRHDRYDRYDRYDDRDSIDTLIDLRRSLEGYEVTAEELRAKIQEIDDAMLAVELRLNTGTIGETSHVHDNKDVLDLITVEKINEWDSKSTDTGTGTATTTGNTLYFTIEEE